VDATNYSFLDRWMGNRDFADAAHRIALARPFTNATLDEAAELVCPTSWTGGWGTYPAGKGRVVRVPVHHVRHVIDPAEIAAGGVRYDVAASLERTAALSLDMLFKKHAARTAALSHGLVLPGNGFKLGAALDPRSLGTDQLAAFDRSVYTLVREAIVGGRVVVATDAGTTPETIRRMIVAGHELGDGWRLDGFTSKPIDLGGSRVRVESTGFGAFCAAEHACERRGIGIPTARAAFVGFGNVGSWAAGFWSAAGGSVAQVGDATGALRVGRSAQRALIAHGKAGGTIASFRHGDVERCDPSDVTDADVDVLFLAGVGPVSLQGVRAELVVVVQNGGVSRADEADYIARGGVVLSELVASGGGALASAAERMWHGGEDNAVRTALRDTIRDTLDAVWRQAEDARYGGLDLGLAAWSFALQEVVTHARECGRL
jgi:glutamate dehydrogenase/leucine dehydrogenase